MKKSKLSEAQIIGMLSETDSSIYLEIFVDDIKYH